MPDKKSNAWERSIQHQLSMWWSKTNKVFFAIITILIVSGMGCIAIRLTSAGTISNLQLAINEAPSGSTLQVPAGTYNSIEITKPLTLVGQSGAIISGGTIGIFIKSSNVTVQGFTVQDFDFSGIYCNGTLSNLTVRNVTVNGGNRAVFGLHFQNDTGGYVDGVTIADSTFLGFTSSSSYNYPAHGVYLKVVRNVSIINVEAGQTAGVGTHSGLDLDDVDTALVDNVSTHNSVVGIAVNRYPSVGNKNITFRNSGGHSNSVYDRFEYGVNYNIVWESTCYGSYFGDPPSVSIPTPTPTTTPTSTTTPTPTTVQGDVNGDRSVTIADLSIIAFNFNKTGMSRSQGDLNNDSKVNISDLSILAANWVT